MTNLSKVGVDFGTIRHRYEKLSKHIPGFASQLGKRIGSPEDLTMVPAFYRLFPGVMPSPWHERLAFILPFLRHSETGTSLGEFLGSHRKANSLERRVLQIARAGSKNHSDVVYLRRLLMRFEEPAVNWGKSGLASLLSTDKEKNLRGKKQLVEHYFVARHTTGKGAM